MSYSTPSLLRVSVAQYPQPAAVTALLRSVSQCFNDAALSCDACPPTWRAITAPVILFFMKFAIVTAHRSIRAADQSQLAPLTAKLQKTQFSFWRQVEKIVAHLADVGSPGFPHNGFLNPRMRRRKAFCRICLSVLFRL